MFSLRKRSVLGRSSPAPLTMRRRQWSFGHICTMDWTRQVLSGPSNPAQAGVRKGWCGLSRISGTTPPLHSASPMAAAAAARFSGSSRSTNKMPSR